MIAEAELPSITAGSNGSASIAAVRISPDLKNATAFVAPLGGDDMEKTAKALNRAQGFLRGRVAAQVELRHAPVLKFVADDSYDEARRIDRGQSIPDLLAGSPGRGPVEQGEELEDRPETLRY